MIQEVDICESKISRQSNSDRIAARSALFAHHAAMIVTAQEVQKKFGSRATSIRLQ